MGEWKEYKFSDFVDINPSVKIPKGIPVPFVEMKDLDNSIKYCESSQEKELSGGSRFLNGDTLFARITPCLENGKICQVRNLKNGCGFGSTEFHVFRGKEGISDTDFVYYLSRWDEVRDFAEHNLEGSSGRQRVSKEAFDNLYLTLPPLETQRRIASILTSMDDKIDLLRRENATLEAMAETLFRQWFVEEAKEEWEEVALGDVVKTTSGGTPSRKHSEYYENGTINWVKSKELEGSFISSTEELITEEAVTNSSAKMLPEKSVLIAMYGATVGEYGILSKPMTCNQAVCALIPNENYPYTYLYVWTALMKEEFINLASGAAQQNISQDLIKQQSVCSDTEKIMQYDKLVRGYFDKMENNQKQIQTLIQTRDGLLPKLMSNEIKI